MSVDWVADIKTMHEKHGHSLKDFDKRQYEHFLAFRLEFLQEELDEATLTVHGDEVVDALIDLCVVAISTLDLFGVNAHLAWDRVLEANMAKVRGVKLTRPNPLGLPDLVKPQGWTAPEHHDNVGLINMAF